jgi:transcriptional regulator with XRE-family HTH domain
MNGRQPVHHLLRQSWGQNVRQARKRRGWTQTQFSSECGYPQSTISQIEAGKYRAMHPELLLRLAVVLGEPVEELFAWPFGITDMARYELEAAS